jgi:hypothetical protein
LTLLCDPDIISIMNFGERQKAVSFQGAYSLTTHRHTIDAKQRVSMGSKIYLASLNGLPSMRNGIFLRRRGIQFGNSLSFCGSVIVISPPPPPEEVDSFILAVSLSPFTSSLKILTHSLKSLAYPLRLLTPSLQSIAPSLRTLTASLSPFTRSIRPSAPSLKVLVRRMTIYIPIRKRSI